MSLPREEGVWRAGERCLAGAGVVPAETAGETASAQLSSVFSKGCPTKKLWAGK